MRRSIRVKSGPCRSDERFVAYVMGELERPDRLDLERHSRQCPECRLRLGAFRSAGLTLERGPVTVIETSEYVGEAVLPFTVAGGELNVPYAVELGVKVREESASRREMHHLHIKGAFLHIEEWDIRRRDYQLNNSTADPLSVLVEHLRTTRYELIETPEPKERTDEHVRFEVEVPARGETTLRVQERRLMRRREELQRQSYKGLERYLERGLIDRETHDVVAELLRLWEKITDNEQLLAEAEKERQKIYKAQEQIQGNMKALSTTGKEGALRARYVTQLEDTEEQLKVLAQREEALDKEIDRLEDEVDEILQRLESSS